MTIIAHTNPITGETTYTELPPDHPRVTENIHLEITPSAELLVANQQDTVILTLQLLDGLNRAVAESRTCLARIGQGFYKFQLDKDGKTSVELKATMPGQIVVEALEPPGGWVMIQAYKPAPPPEDLEQLPIHTGSIVFDG